MTGIFDFVLRVIPFSIELDFAGVAEDVLKETISRNQNNNFRVWFDGTTHSELYMDYDLDDLADFFRDFHNLDHAHHHKVWCRISHSILYQFEMLFLDIYNLSQLDFLFEKDFRTLRKYVPSINDYISRFYNKEKCGIHTLKKELNEK